jgi:hypothetical protein
MTPGVDDSVIAFSVPIKRPEKPLIYGVRSCCENLHALQLLIAKNQQLPHQLSRFHHRDDLGGR